MKKNEKRPPKHRHTKAKDGNFTLPIFLLLNKEIMLIIHYRIQNKRLKSYKAPTTLVRF